MKNAIKKMKWGILALGLVLGMGLALSLRADIKYFWLDHPTGRNNPNDPLSPLYKSPVTTPNGTATLTPTISPTFTVTPNLTETYEATLGTATDTLTATPTPTPSDTPSQTPNYTATGTPTNTPSPTQTTTPQAAGWPCLYGEYNGNSQSVTLSSNEFSSGGTDGAVEVAGSGPGGATYYADVTLSSGAFAAVMEFSNGFWSANNPITETAGSYTALSITVAIPPLNGGSNPSLIVPAVCLFYEPTGASYTVQTVAVNLDNFIVGGPQFIQPSASAGSPVWYTAVVPLSVFTALANTSGVTATAGDFDGAAGYITGVGVQPFNYGNTGVISTEVYVGSVIFATASNATCPVPAASGAGANQFSTLFADFEDGTADYWGGYWSANVDSFTATDCPGYVAAPGNPNLSSIVYGGVTDTAGVSGSDTPSHDGHLCGWLGAENGPYGSPACTNTNAFPYLNSTADLAPSGPAPTNAAYDVNLSDNSYITTLPPTGATGLSFRLKLGPNSDPAEVYKVFIDRDSGNTPTIGTAVATSGTGTADNAGYIYYVQIAGSSLSAANWTSFAIPFPPDGFCSGCTSGGTTYPTGLPSAAVTTPLPTSGYATGYGAHNDQGGNTELFWGQDQYNVSTTGWWRNDIYDIGYGPLLRGKEGDIYIDDVQFYAGAGPLVAVRKR